MPVSTTAIRCPQGLVHVTEANDLNLRHVYFKDEVIGTLRFVGSDRYEIAAKKGTPRKGFRHSLEFSVCTVLTAHLVKPTEPLKELPL